MGDTTNHSSGPPHVDVAVVGGGVGGLTAATVAAGSGASVALFDARSDLGGRARTVVDAGFSFNEGPHALYRASCGAAVLKELGVRPKGGNPPLTRSRLSIDGRLCVAPPPRALRQVVGLLRGLGRDARDPGLVAVGTDEWIDARVADPVGRQFAAALVRVSSYSGDLATFSADAAATQLHAALRGVTYLHGGWRQLVDALDGAARSAGVEVTTGAKVDAIHVDGGRWVVTEGDRSVSAGAVVIATGGPGGADRIVGGASDWLASAQAAAVPVHAACLDLGLRRLPRPSRRFVLGVDRTSYASVHTPGAHLADHGHVVHLMQYEPADGFGLPGLEALADELQPGWRDHEAARQIGLRRVVAFDRPQPGTGLRGRPGATVPDLPGVFVAGDWVGPDDLLGTAAITSGKAAGLAAARHGTSAPYVPAVSRA